MFNKIKGLTFGQQVTIGVLDAVDQLHEIEGTVAKRLHKGPRGYQIIIRNRKNNRTAAYLVNQIDQIYEGWDRYVNKYTKKIN
ncbi:hypothetical protein ACTFSJ_27550 [Bacillus cereus group sp. MYBK12-2]|uniref:hypothetical protein n=1 Tax=Bacillus cereus group sp. MYBK12-2 TaxID=3450689 RepID=UPI0032FD8ABC|nr:hypothetical protein [Bacillus pacificus]HDR7653568.1 hypothetical protein [Bacillus pacificus]